MARIEKTVFISYRRTNAYTALAVYENLKNQGYDVFFDYTSISSGDFEQIITSNIRARAHFLLILTPTALNRCNEPGDWLRREIEIAIDEKRNIIPLFFKGFRFGAPSVSEKLTDKLKYLSRYNGLNVHEDYFQEAMQRVRTQFLNIPLDTVLHPVSTEVRKIVREEQVAADRALEQIEDVKKLVKQAEEKPAKPEAESALKPERESAPPARTDQNADVRISPRTLPDLKNIVSKSTFRLLGFVVVAVLITIIAVWAIRSNFFIPKLGIGSTMISEKDGMTLLYVPAGEFTMGSETYDDEKPIHTVALDAFWIDKTEVTNKMYALCVQASVCKEPKSKSSYTHLSYFGNPEFDNYPVIYVDWNMAKTYCEWADRRLPTEAEWEKAARGENAFNYPWGNDAENNTLLNYNNAVGDTTEVGKYPDGKSIYGALDMAGNVWEWVSSLYQPYSFNATDGRESLTSSDVRVLRGGSWDLNANDVRSANRHWLDPSYTTYDRGFRCSRSP